MYTITKSKANHFRRRDLQLCVISTCEGHATKYSNRAFITLKQIDDGVIVHFSDIP